MAHGDNVTEAEIRDLRARSIIIVDDDVSFRESLVSLVKSYGFHPHAFESGEDLLESDALKDAACLVTDVQMRGMSGLDLQARIAQSGCEIPIIVVTSFPDKQIRDRAMSAGAVAVLKKPVDREELLQLLQAAVKCPRPDRAEPVITASAGRVGGGRA